jgi:group I intron endonuclease
MNTNIIYRLIAPNGKSYIGMTIRGMKRINEHKNSKSNFTIDRAIQKYGWNNFKLEILEEVNDSKLLPELEKYYIKKYDTFNDGYNETFGGEQVMIGKHHSKETKKKISIANTGRQFSDEHRNKLSKIKKGKHHSEETKNRMSIAKLGKPSWNKNIQLSEETKNRMSIAKLGKKRKPFSEEHLKNMSIAKLGKKRKPLSQETKSKISNALIGKLFSEEHKLRISNAKTGKTKQYNN